MQYQSGSLFRRLFGRTGMQGQPSRTARARRTSVKPRLEALEDRTLLSLVYTPAITTVPGGPVTLGSGAALTDSATLTGGTNGDPVHPTHTYGGTITFELFAPGVNTLTGTPVYTDPNVPVTGDGTYNTSTGDHPGGWVPTGTGTLTGQYQWVALYSGDANNNPVATNQPGPLVMDLPEGTGGALVPFAVSGFDPGPGNLLITGVKPTGLHMGDTVESYFQANMSAVLGTNSNNPLALPGLGSKYQLSVVARFTEVVTTFTSSNGGLGASADFALASPQTSPFFEIWIHNTAANGGVDNNNLTGAGFATGTKVLSGRIGNLSNSHFDVTDFTVQYGLDNGFPGDGGGTPGGIAYWSGTTTVTGSGNSSIALTTMQVNSVALNSTYFPGGQTVVGFAGRPSTGLEYQNVDPSQNFDAQPDGGGSITSIPTGIVNGLDFSTLHNPGGKQVIETDDKYSSTATQTELETVNPASPSISSNQMPDSGTIGTVLNDKVTLSGGFNPTGTITVKLYPPGNTTTPVYTDVITMVPGQTMYNTSTDGTPTPGSNNVAQVVGTYRWVASYTSGDGNNMDAAGGLNDEPVIISNSSGTPPRTIGYWKNHEVSDSSGGYFVAPNGAHISSVTLGSATYTADQAVAIMQLSISGGNALLQLFDQLTAYRLNLTIGSTPTASAITAAMDGDAAIVAASVAAVAPTSKIVVSSGTARWATAGGTSSGILAFVQASTTLGQEMVNDAGALATFNQSGL
jgi:hypothetical protein